MLDQLTQDLAGNKRRLVAAHRGERWQEACSLSLQREVIKKRIRRISDQTCECGRFKTRFARHCWICYVHHRFYRNKLK